jgi:RNA polymerase sigma factor (sigma-70 family)
MEEDRMANSNESFLWEKFRNGDKKALKEIYYAHYENLYNYGLKIYNEPAFIKDCIQELFFELISKLSSLGPTDNISFYLLASFRRKVFDKLKRDHTVNYAEKDGLTSHTETEESPEEEWIDREEEHLNRKTLNTMLEHLHTREKEAIYLRFYRNLPYKEITSIMEINYESARKLVYRGLHSLRKMSDEFKGME